MEHFVIIVNGWKPLTNITESSILDVAAVLDPPLSIRFVFETAFISEQIAEDRSAALLKISEKFITKFNVFSCMNLQFRFKTVWKISKPYRMTLKTVAR